MVSNKYNNVYCVIALRVSIINIIISPVVPIVIGFEETRYSVNESVGSVEVFVSVLMPRDGQMLVGGADVLIQTIAGSASKN